MLNNYIHEKANLISYSQLELSNIANTLSNLKNIINNEPDFRSPFLGGSYKRATMVKGVSDVDVYFQYTGTGNSQIALAKLKKSLSLSYPTSIIKQDRPSILADFNKIPINITPYKQDIFNTMQIPDNNLIGWTKINLEDLEKSITLLRNKNSRFIDLIKILKLWNFNHKKGLKNFEIEKSICSLFLNQLFYPQNIAEWMVIFFNNKRFYREADTISNLNKRFYNEANIKSEWLKFIDNK